MKLTSDLKVAFISADSWDAIEFQLPVEVRAQYSTHGYPYVEANNGMQWRYLPFISPLDTTVLLVVDYPGIKEQWREALNE